jgi:hypothetical protein
MEKREWSDLFTADLAVADPEIARLIAAQERQNRTTVNLVASETYCPAATLAAAIVAAAQQILTVLPSLYWLACWCSRKAYIWPLSLLAPR